MNDETTTHDLHAVEWSEDTVQLPGQQVECVQCKTVYVDQYV